MSASLVYPAPGLTRGLVAWTGRPRVRPGGASRAWLRRLRPPGVRPWPSPRRCRRPCRRPLPSRWSYSPATTALNELIVSSSGTWTPSEPVNTLATSKGCDRKRWILRARATVSLSSFAQFVHPQNGDDVLQRLVALQDALHVTGHLIMLFAHDLRVHQARVAVQRVHGRVDAQFGDRPVQEPWSRRGGQRWWPGAGSVRSSAGT